MTFSFNFFLRNFLWFSRHFFINYRSFFCCFREISLSITDFISLSLRKFATNQLFSLCRKRNFSCLHQKKSFFFANIYCNTFTKSPYWSYPPNFNNIKYIAPTSITEISGDSNDRMFGWNILIWAYFFSSKSSLFSLILTTKTNLFYELRKRHIEGIENSVGNDQRMKNSIENYISGRSNSTKNNICHKLFV